MYFHQNTTFYSSLLMFQQMLLPSLECRPGVTMVKSN